MAFSTSHFWVLARMIAADHGLFTREVAERIAATMKGENSKFRHHQFMNAAGYGEDAVPRAVSRVSV